MATHQGMADAGREQVGRMVLEAWDAFISEAESVDLGRSSRLGDFRVSQH